MIDLEPSLELDTAAGSGDRRPGIDIRPIHGSAGSLTRETQLAPPPPTGIGGALSRGGFPRAVFVEPIGGRHRPLARIVHAVSKVCHRRGLRGVIVSRIGLSPGQVRGLEYLLFGSFTVILIVTQYTVNLDLLTSGRNPRDCLSHMKNGVMGMFALMVIYGMFIPNDVRHTAGVVLTMALAMLVGMDLLIEREDIANVAEQLHTTRARGLQCAVPHDRGGTGDLWHVRLEWPAVRSARGQEIRPVSTSREAGGRRDGRSLPGRAPVAQAPCALKLIKPEAGDDPIALARFEREVQSAARLSHPNTIEIYDYGHTDDGTFYYVMEYLPGMSLQDLVHKYGPLPVGRAIYLFRQVCAGLAEAHSIGLDPPRLEAGERLHHGSRRRGPTSPRYSTSAW